MELLKREYYIAKLRAVREQPLIKVITGVRRSGKSTILKLFQEELLADGVSEKQIIAINFEDPDYSHEQDWYSIYSLINKQLSPDTMHYIFLDEVQYIPDFERLLVGLQSKENTDVYVTGSNAHLLSSELATLLSGRSIEINVTPYSFREFKAATASFYKERTNDEIFNSYLANGGFPQVAALLEHSPEMIPDYLRGIYETIVTRDIMKRYNFSSKTTLDNIANFLLSNIGSFSNSNSISKGLSPTISHHTIPDYLSALINSYLFYPAQHVVIRGKELLRPQNKYYAVDLGLRYALIGKGSAEDMGSMLENVVFYELLRREGVVHVGKVENKEVDFVVQLKNGDREYYQVSWSVRNTDTLQRELAPLQMIKDYSPRYLLTMDPEEPSHEGIKQLNVLNWLLDNGSN